ncbi:MAG: VanW family protein [Armatimonadetes bacterium]|nr:VanW family protein [Armatimonadota bacterium]MDW8121602.1 VanW family protein [Armatimonadota bacterium]
MRKVGIWWIVVASLAIGCSGSQPVVLAEFATPLANRTEGQVYNALKAARAINGRLIRPGEVFSFNKAVGEWSQGRGYVRAPVSLGGILVLSWGGGVCQASTTLYGAALFAGLAIVERHAHSVAPTYVATGLDAAVAPGVADLKIRNPHPFSVGLRFFRRHDRLICQVIGFCSEAENPFRKGFRWVVRREVVADNPKASEGVGVSNRPGQTIRVWRLTFQKDLLIRQELCHETEYQPSMSVFFPARH